MQIDRFVLFLLLILIPLVSFCNQVVVSETIDNGAYEILEGKFEPKQIIKIKIYNDKYENDEYFAFLMTDEQGKYLLTQDDIDLKRLKDGNLIFEVSTNDEDNAVSIDRLKKTLDRGLTLHLSSRADNELKSDDIVNKSESIAYIIEGETELNIKELNITISDELNRTIQFDISDIVLENNGIFRIENVDLSALKDGKIIIEAFGIDIAENISKVKQIVLKDTIVDEPALLKKIKNNNLSNVVNKKIIIASGTSEANSTVYFEFRQGDVLVQESVVANTNGEWELVGADLDVSVFENKQVEVEIYQIDVAKNQSTKFKYINEKFKRPIFPLSPIPIDPEKYQLIYTIAEFNDEIKDIVITDKEIFVATYGLIKVWGKSYAKFQREVEVGNGWVNSLVVYGTKVFAALDNGDINVYNEEDLKFIYAIKADDLPILHLELFEDKIISSSSSGLIKIWDTSIYKNLNILKNHQWDVGTIAVKGTRLYSGSDDYSIKVWDLQSGGLIRTIKSAHAGTINDLIVYGDTLISASDDKSVVIRDINSGEIKHILKAHKKSVNKLKITNDFLISISSDRNMIFWDMQSGKILKKIKAHSKKIDAIDVNDFNIVTGSRDYKLKIWGYDDSVESLDSDDETLKPKYALLKSFNMQQGTPTALSQDENNIIISSDNGYVFFYNKITHDYVKSYTTLDEIVKPLVESVRYLDEEFDDEYNIHEEESQVEDESEVELKLQKVFDISNYGNKLLAALEDSTVKIWDLEKDEAITLLRGTEMAVTDIKVTPTYILAATKKGNIGVHDIETGDFVNLIEGHQYNINSLALYEDDKVVSAGEDYSIKIRDIESGDLILDIKNAHDDIITKVLVYENLLISGSMDNTIKIRDIQNGKLIKCLDVHKSGVTSMVLDNENLISASNDKTLIAWELKNFNLLATMNAHRDAVVDVMITDDYIISIAKDKSIKVWKYYE